MQARRFRSLGAHTRPSAVSVVTVLAVVAVFVVALLPSPYAVEQPGPVYDTLGSSGTGKDRAPLISIPGKQTYPTTGRLDLLTVSVLGNASGGPSWFDLAEAWLDPDEAVIPLEAVFPQGETQQQAEQQSAQQMTASQRSAITAALTRLGYTVDGTVTIGSVQRGSAAAGSLQRGDVVTTFAGRPIDDACSLQNAVAANGTAQAAVVIERGGKRETLRIAPRETDDGAGGTRPLLGVTTSATMRYPFDVDLRIDDVGGPSAGMMFALGIIDKLTPGSLTGGRHVAGTGTICGDGRVGAIGGIVQKLSAARAAGATLFLAPAANCDEVVGHIPSGLDVVAVDTLSDSLEALEQVRETGSARGLPTCSARVSSAG
ncbi:PDZ domain-containing protein [uncultured Amnibacterium sp.]|uniref:YlbL family protein n=1 Tax=uncultured Amnibacterium sp. TaxID=1631851 RepID=UPI0035CA9491